MASDNFMSFLKNLLKIRKNSKLETKVKLMNSDPCFIFPLFSPTIMYLVKCLFALILKTQYSKYFSKIGLFGGFSGCYAIYLVDKINWFFLGKLENVVWFTHDENFRSKSVIKTRHIPIKNIKFSPAIFQA